MKREATHVVQTDHQEFAFDRVQDALALIKLLSRAKVRPAVSVRQRPPMAYVAAPTVRYESKHEGQS
jgi:hypothetical protein